MEHKGLEQKQLAKLLKISGIVSVRFRISHQLSHWKQTRRRASQQPAKLRRWRASAAVTRCSPRWIGEYHMFLLDNSSNSEKCIVEILTDIYGKCSFKLGFQDGFKWNYLMGTFPLLSIQSECHAISIHFILLASIKSSFLLSPESQAWPEPQVLQVLQVFIGNMNCQNHWIHKLDRPVNGSESRLDTLRMVTIWSFFTVCYGPVGPLKRWPVNQQVLEGVAT